MTLSQKARKAVAASLAVSTLVWAAAFTVVPASAAPHSEGCLVNVSGTVYKIMNGEKRGFTSAEVFMSHGYNFGQVVGANSDDASLSTGSIQIYANGTLVKGPNDPLVYLVVNGQKRGFTSGAVFTGLGYSFANIQWAPVNTFTDIPTGSNINSTSESGLPMGGPGPQTVNCSTGTDDGSLDGGEGELTNIDEVSADETGIEEAQNGVELFAFEAEADGSDVRVNRIDLYIDETSGNGDSDNADEYFEGATLFANGEEVDDVDVSDWTEENYGQVAGTDGDEFRIRFAPNNIVDDGDTVTYTVEFDAVSNIDTGDLTAVWTLTMNALDSIRATDGAGISDEYGPASDATAAISIDAATAGTLEVSLNDENPDAQVVEVDDTADTNDVEVLMFDLEADEGDILVEDLVVTVDDVGTLTNIDTVVTTLHLWLDGEEIASENITATTGLTEDVTFSDIDVTIEDGEVAEFTVSADIENIQAGAVGDFDEGDGIFVSFTSVTAEDEEGDNVEATGTAVGNNFAFYTEGIMVSDVVVTEEKTVSCDGACASGSAERAEFKFTFDVTAFGGDIFVDDVVEDAGTGHLYEVTGTDTTVAVITSSADASGGLSTWIVREGQTETFTITLNVIPAGAGVAASGFFTGDIDAIQWSATNVAEDNAASSQYNFDMEDFLSDPVFLSENIT